MKRILIILLLLSLNLCGVSSKNLWFNGNNSYITTGLSTVLNDKYTVVVKCVQDTIAKDWGHSLYYTSLFYQHQTCNSIFIYPCNGSFGGGMAKHAKEMLTLVADSMVANSFIYLNTIKKTTSSVDNIPARAIYVGYALSSLLGTIYDFQYYHAILDSSQVAYIYNHRLPLNHDSLKIWYDFQHYNSAGDSIYDMSGNNNHGKIFNCELKSGSFIKQGVK